MLQKDTFRLIKKTFNRFFSLLMIVLIGVAFMMGLLSTGPIMEESVDIYDDDCNLQDIQIYSSYGFDDNDIKALESEEFVHSYFASKMLDVYSESEDGYTAVTRVEELERDVNNFILTEGTYPKKEYEILLLDSGLTKEHYQVGSRLKIYLEDEDITDYLLRNNFVISGIVKSPAYMAKTLETSTMKNLELDVVIYVPNSNFIGEYYRTIYIEAEGAKEYDSFSGAYDAYMEELIGDAEYFSKSQQDKLKDKLIEEYTDEIKESEEELEVARHEGQSKLDEAKERLDDANVQIVAGEAQIESLNAALGEAVSRQAALERQYGAAPRASMDKIKEIERADSEGRSFEEIYSQLAIDYGTYTALKNLSGQDASQIETAGDAAINQARERLSEADDRKAALESEGDALVVEIADPEISNEERTEKISRIAAIEVELGEIEIEKEAYQRIISTYDDLQEEESQVKSSEERMAELNSKYGGSISDRFTEYGKLEQDRVIYGALQQEIDVANSAISSVRAQISEMQGEITRGKMAYEEGLNEYRQSVIDFNLEIEKGEAEIRKAYQELDELPDAEWIILGRDDHYSTYLYSNNSKQMGAIGISLPLLFYLVAALVCMTTMTRLVDEQRGQIGILRALGFSKTQIIGKYVVYALLATIVGSVAGIFIGMLIFPTVIYNTWRIMYDLPDIKIFFPWIYVLVCFVLFSALMAIVTYFVVKRTLNEVPSELMRPKAPKNAKKILLEYFTSFWNKLSFTSKITARNLIRYKSRFIMTVIGVAGCTALLVVGWGIKDSIEGIVSIQYGELFNYDYSVYVEENADVEKFAEVLESNLDNEKVAPMLEYSSMVYMDGEESTINAVVIDARSGNDVFNLRKTDGETEVKIKNNGVIISEKFAKNNGIKAGDYITIESESGIKAEVKVSDICEMYFQHYLFISDEYYYTTFSEHAFCKTIVVKNQAGDNFVEDIEDMSGFISMVDFTHLTDQFNNMIRALDFIILVIIFTAGALAFVVLINLSQVNISERVREIATIKVLGFRRGEVNSYIFKEIFLLSVIGGLIGLPLGIVEHHFIMNVINMEMIMFSNNIKLMTFIYAYGITLIFTVIVLMMMRRPLKKIEMIESLKSVE